MPSLRNADLTQRLLPSLRRLAREKRPVAAALKISRMIRAAEQLAADVETTRRELLARHAKQDDQGRPISSNPGDPTAEPVWLTPADRAECMREVDELLRLETDYPHTLSLAELGLDGEGAAIEAEVLLGLGDVLEV